MKMIGHEHVGPQPGSAFRSVPRKFFQRRMHFCIGENSSVDSQPCGGTHVSETQEVGQIHISKIEKKGKENRRFKIRFGVPSDV